MRETEKRSRIFAKVLRRRMTDAEVILWSRLRYWPQARFRRQHPVGPYIADFACITARLVIEVDGATHGRDIEVTHDARRDAYMKTRGWHVLRISNEDVYGGLDTVLDLIAHHIAPSTAASLRSARTSFSNSLRS